MNAPKNKNVVCSKVLIEACVEKEVYHLPHEIVRIGGDPDNVIKRGFIKQGKEVIKQVVIPNTVTAIGAYSFSRCQNLEDINLPPNLISIGPEAFMYCQNLKTIILPDSLKKIGHSAFYKCEKITSITIPLCVSEIHDDTFNGCKSLENLKLHDNIKRIGFSAFYNTKIKNVQLPKNLQSLGVGAFSNTLLDEVEIPKKLSEIEHRTFLGCKIKQVIIPSNIKSVGTQAFAECDDLEKVYIYDCTDIADDAFYCSGKVTIYSGKNSNAEEYAKKHNLPFVEVPSFKMITMACQKDRPELLKYLIEKHPVPNWLFKFLIEDIAYQNNAQQCIRFLAKWKSENL